MKAAKEPYGYEIRRDPHADRWNIVGVEKTFDIDHYKKPLYTESGARCPFCEGAESETPSEIFAYSENPKRTSNQPGWQVRVCPNKYPALLESFGGAESADGIYQKRGAFGYHEVIIESPRHETNFADLSLENIRLTLMAYKRRILAHKRDERIKYILIFKNQGRAAGATLAHVHSQLVASPLLPELVALEESLALERYKRSGESLLCEITQKEIAYGERMINEFDGFISFCPYSSRLPFEIMIAPLEPSPFYEETPDNKLNSLALTLKEVLLKLMRAANNPAFNMILHTAPPRGQDSRHFQWHIEVVPRLSVQSGAEIGAGLFINEVSPEFAAKTLRESKI